MVGSSFDLVGRGEVDVCGMVTQEGFSILGRYVLTDVSLVEYMTLALPPFPTVPVQYSTEDRHGPASLLLSLTSLLNLLLFNAAI